MNYNWSVILYKNRVLIFCILIEIIGHFLDSIGDRQGSVNTINLPLRQRALKKHTFIFQHLQAANKLLEGLSMLLFLLFWCENALKLHSQIHIHPIYRFP